MRQVPHYLLIGNGRVANHFAHYFAMLDLSFERWHREKGEVDLKHKLEQASHVLLLISDHAIQSFADTYLPQHRGIHIHFSGSVNSSSVYGAHPLQTFNSHQYALEAYQAIPFVIDHDATEFSTMLPGLPNQSVRLNKANKAKYHAMCVIAGNFSCMLWQKLFAVLEDEFKLPKAIAYPFLQQQTDNLITNSDTALTGPLIRNDQETLNKHISLLEGDAFQHIYKSFIACYEQLQEEVSA